MFFIYEVCPKSIQPNTMKKEDIYWRRYKRQETLYIGQWRLSPLQSRYLGTSHSSPNCHQLPHHIFLNLFPFKGDFSFGKARSLRVPNLGCSGAASSGWLYVSSKISVPEMHEQVCCHDEAVNYLLPTGVAFWIIQIVSGEEYSSLMQNMMQIYCSLISHFDGKDHTIHMLTQQHLPPPLTIMVKLSLFTHVHSSSLFLAARLHWCCANSTCYINNGWNFFWTNLIQPFIFHQFPPK